jgi:hypothetical protein
VVLAHVASRRTPVLPADASAIHLGDEDNLNDNGILRKRSGSGCAGAGDLAGRVELGERLIASAAHRSSDPPHDPITSKRWRRSGPSFRFAAARSRVRPPLPASFQITDLGKTAAANGGRGRWGTGAGGGVAEGR